MKAAPAVTEHPTRLAPRSRFKGAMVLATAADALQIFVFPCSRGRVGSPARLALGVPATFLAELVPRVDLVPFWTLAVISVYRKWKQITITAEPSREQRPALKGQNNSS